MINSKSDYDNIIVTGSVAYDEIMDFPGEFKDYFHPEKLHQINVSFVVDKLEKQLGGTATNIAYNASLILNSRSFDFAPRQLACRFAQDDRRGIKLKLLGSVGKDGKEFIKFFKKNKIDVSGVIVDKKLYTASGKVITDIKDNQIWGFYYGASESAKKISLKKFSDKNSLLVISASHSKSFLHFQSEAIKNKIDYLYDPGMTLTWISDKDLEQGVMNARYLVGNDYEMAMIMKRLNPTSPDSVGIRGARKLSVITTLGEKGVNYYSGVIPVKTGIQYDNSLFVPAVKVKKMVDPTGAGDAWRGGFISGLALGMKTVDCLKLGNVMASFAIEKYGTVNHKPNSIDIEKRMNKI